MRGCEVLIGKEWKEKLTAWIDYGKACGGAEKADHPEVRSHKSGISIDVDMGVVVTAGNTITDEIETGKAAKVNRVIIRVVCLHRTELVVEGSSYVEKEVFAFKNTEVYNEGWGMPMQERHQVEEKD